MTVFQQLFGAAPTAVKIELTHPVTRRQFLGISLLAGIPALTCSTLAGQVLRRSPAASGEDDRQLTVRQLTVRLREDQAAIKNILEAIEQNPHHVVNYDRLTRLYGKYKEYDLIYRMLLKARLVLENKVRRTPARYKRYRTALRLINERVLRVESIRRASSNTMKTMRGYLSW